MPTATQHTLSIEYGSTSVSIPSILAYNPKYGGDGVDEVAEDMQIISAKGLTADQMDALQDSLTRAFVQAKRYTDTTIGDRVYLHMQKQGSDFVYRSPIRTGKAMLTDDGLGAWWRNGMLRQMVVFTRDNYWETVTEYELALSNTSTSAVTGGVTVYGHDDGDSGHDTYVQIASTQVIGSLPTPPRLEITNTFVGTAVGDIFVNLNAFATPSTFSHILEAEDAVSNFATTTNVAVSALSSNGSSRDVTWTASTAIQLYRWSLSSSLLTAINGNRVRFATVFANFAPSSLYVHWRVLFNGLTPVASSEDREILLSASNKMQLLGDMYLPPRNLGTGTSGGLSLALYGRSDGGSMMAIDFVQLCVMDGSRMYRYISYGLFKDYRLIDDPANDAIWVDTGASTDRFPLYSKPEGTLLLQPAKTQRLYFLSRSVTGNAEIARTFSIRAYVRYRRALP